MITDPIQRRAYDAVAAALPFPVDPAKVTVEQGASYLPSPIKLHDYAAGVMAAFGSVVEHIGAMRGLPSQTMTLNRRLCGFHLNELQTVFLNGYSIMLDTWPITPDNGTYRAKDGRFVTMIGLHPHLRDAFLDYFQCANSQPALQAAVEKYTSEELEREVFGKLNLGLGIVRTPEEWLAHPQGAATANLPMIDFQQHGTSTTRVLGTAKYRPLEGVRVVDLTQVVAGPSCGYLLAEQGADVILVHPPRGDWVTPIWLSVNFGKKSILTDLKDPAGMKRFVEMLSQADVLISSQRPGALDALGLSEAELRRINPNLIYAPESWAPPGTPWAGHRGFEQIAQAVSGAMHVHSEGLGLDAPTVTPALMNDHITGYLLAIGVVAALAEREQKGGFWRVDTSLTRCSTMALELVGPVDSEPYVPITMQDLLEHAVDQPGPWGTFTRMAPSVTFSHTPSFALRPAPYPGTDPDTIGWNAHPDGPPEVTHYPSKLVRDGLIRNFVPNFGLEDRCDGGGVVSMIVNPANLEAQLKKYSTTVH